MLDLMLGPSLLSLAAAAMFALQVLYVRKGLDFTDAITGTCIAIGTSMLIFWAAAPLYMERAHWSSPALLIFGAVGLFRPSISTWLSNFAIKEMGPTIAATVGAVGPMFTVAGGVLLLAEPLSGYTVLGTVGIVAGVMIISWRGRATPGTWTAFALLLPLGSAVLRAVAHIMVKLGLETLPEPFMAGLMGFTVSFAVALPAALLQRRRAPRPIPLGGWYWFALSGVSNAAAIMALNTALRQGYLVLVGPLTATFPLFTLLFSVMFFRQETFTARTLGGVVAISAGVIVITLLH
ncbi:MAG: DMT family transporter [SAR324 cluster bacterium]|nr:DMT family transporter [SAR324 cluster bacterium]